MLPEHVEMIRQLWAEDDYKEKPVLSGQQLEENEFILQTALKNNLSVEIKYYKDHDYRLIEGKVSFIMDQLIINEVKIELSDMIEIRIL